MSPGCPDAEDFAALLSHTLDSDRRAEIIDHAASCADCHVLIAEVAVPETVLSVDPQADTRVPDEGSAPVRRMLASVLQIHERPARVGRYHLLEIVGRGGMGVVWGAWDPQVARRVALKLLHPTMAAARDRILAEGQALAKLSHPNVVPVYDVGVIDDQVYLVMEWVQGITLRAYASSRGSQRDLIDAYRQAGEGLAAAHSAGLIHRDFKPDNAIRGDDGRVRVLDFGLAEHRALTLGSGASEHERAERPVLAARGSEPEGARLAGTPRYMPPEQAIGGPLTPAADQYAFALSLQEALKRKVGDTALEVPSWMTGILARGTARDPAERFPSMRELLRALSRDPVRIWRRRGIAAAAVGAAIAAFIIGRAHSDAPTCTGSAAEIARSWNPAVRTAVLEHVRGLGAFGAGQASRLADDLDRYGEVWAGEHHRACAAHESGELPATLYERRLGCLARGKTALTTVAELLTQIARGDAAAALIAARSLPSAAACTAEDASLVAPPADGMAMLVAVVEQLVERATVLAVAARAEAVAVARAGVAAAESTGHAPLISRALVAQARAELALDTGEAAARAALERAVDLALRSGDDVSAVEAYARLIDVVQRHRGDILDNWSVMEAIAARTGPLGRFGRALLYNNKAIARLAASDRAGARALLQRALAESLLDPAAPPVRGPVDNEIELISIPFNLVLVTDDLAEREARIRQVIEQREAALGANHPETLVAWFTAGTLFRDPAAAARAFRTAQDGYQHWHPQLAVEIASAAFERAWVADERGDAAEAIEAMRVAAMDPLSPRERDRGTIAARYLRIMTDDRAELAIEDLQRVAASLAKDARWWMLADAADAYVAAGVGWDHLGRPDEAEPCWSAALAVLERVSRPMLDRRLARVRATLARRWARSRPEAARALARHATEWYRGVAGYDALVTELTALANPRPSPRR